MFSIFSYVYWLFVYLLWRNVYLSPLSIFNFVVVVVVWVFDLFWISIPYLIYDMQIFFTFHWLPFHSVGSVLWCKSILNFIEVQFYLVFSFVAYVFGVISKKLRNPNIMKLFLYVFLWKFYGFSSLAFKFRSLIHFELIFVHGVRLLHVDIQLSQHHLLKRISFPYWMTLSPSSKII